ncbi:MAG: hypothetical protein J6A08_03285 [Lachnospiraceae bacterium]|nr:hypothetical protein [Lachnospiraceae bacterium]
MKITMKKRIPLILALALTIFSAGCGRTERQAETQANGSESSAPSTSESQDTVQTPEDEEDAGLESNVQDAAATDLIVRFGDTGEAFTLHLYDNETAAAIARHVGTADWRLPIYHYDDYENWEVMQYYDIPSRYEIPSNPESVTTEQAGTVYYSEPNRIILFYQDAEVSGEYTPVGYFDYTEDFVTAVEENPVLEGWGNKIVQISDSE